MNLWLLSRTLRVLLKIKWIALSSRSSVCVCAFNIDVGRSLVVLFIYICVQMNCAASFFYAKCSRTWLAIWTRKKRRVEFSGCHRDSWIGLETFYGDDLTVNHFFCSQGFSSVVLKFWNFFLLAFIDIYRETSTHIHMIWMLAVSQFNVCIMNRLVW